MKKFIICLRSLKKEPTINKIISHPMNNNLKKSLINEKINHLSINNILKETIDDKKNGN